MKKIANIAATLAMATAFCGFCTGVALNVTANAETTPAPTVSTSAVGASPKVILSPGAFYNNSIEASAGSKVTKLTAAEEGQYFVENAWFANYSVGEELPKATTTRTGVTFLGWRYTVDGEPRVVGTMPAVTDDLYLYAHWSAGDVGSNPGVPDIPVIPGTDPTLTSSQVLLKFSDAKVVVEFAKPVWATTPVYVYAWTGSTEHGGGWPGAAISGNTINISGTLSSLEGIIVNFKENSTEKQSTNFKSELVNGQIIKIDIDNVTWGSGDSSNEFTPNVTKTAF